MEDSFFFSRHDGIRLAELAAAIGAELADENAADRIVTGVAPLSRGGEGDLTFIASRRFADMLTDLNATAVLCQPKLTQLVPSTTAILVAAKPQVAFDRAAQLLYPQAIKPAPFVE